MPEWWDYAFMRRALAATTLLSFSVAPVGAFLVLRRMSLAGEAMAHAMVPGLAAAFAIAGLSAVSMAVGGLAAGLGVALLAGALARSTVVREDAGLASLYLVALALGVFVLSAAGSAVPLQSFLFGSVLGIGDDTLALIAAVAAATLGSFVFLLRPLTQDTVDPAFHASRTGGSTRARAWFAVLVVLNLLAGFKAMGTLMAVGLMILPATAARCWASTAPGFLLATLGFALASCWGGLALSWHAPAAPSGPAIVLVAGACFALSACFGPHGLDLLGLGRRAGR